MSLCAIDGASGRDKGVRGEGDGGGRGVVASIPRWNRQRANDQAQNENYFTRLPIAKINESISKKMKTKRKNG